MKGRGRGFTLIEAVICLAVAGVLLGVAVPVWESTMARIDAAAARGALLSTLSLAVHHSAVTGSEVVICPGNSDGCRDSFDWTRGWIAYADLDGDRIQDGRDTLLRLQPALSGRIRLLTSTGRRRLVFQPSGGNAGSNVTFTLCRGGSGIRAESLILSNSGRLHPGKPSPIARRACAARLAQ